MKASHRLLTGIVLASALALAGCSSTASAPKDNGATAMTIGWDAAPASWDPVKTPFVPSPYFQAVYESLVSRDPAGELIPGLATKWSWDDTQTQLTLTLREGITFTDGTAFDAAAAKINLERFRDGNGPRTATMAGVTAVTAVDPSTVAITLSAPDPSFLINLSAGAGQMASPAAIQAGTLETAPAGTGPYQLDTAKTRTGSLYAFTKTATKDSPATFDEVDVRVISDPSAQLNALKSGEIDVTIFSSPQSEMEARNSGFSSIKTDGQWLGLALFDRAGTVAPPLANVSVRQAINYAFDKESMNKAFFDGNGTVTSQIFGPLASGHSDAEAYGYDPDKSRALLAKAGYPNGLTIQMPYVNWFGDELASAIQGSLKDVGITVEYVQGDPNPDALIGEMQSGRYPASFGAFSYLKDDWTTLNEMVLPNAAWNPFHTSDAFIQERAAAYPLADQEKKAALASEINQYLTEQAWFAPLVSVSPTTFYSSKMKAVDAAQPLPVWNLYMFSPA